MSGSNALRHLQYRGEERAFTLIELLVVISIIMLLMALLLPALHTAKKQTQAVVCQSKLRQWGIAFYAYVADNDGKMVDGLSQPWYYPLKAYCTDYNDMLLCPAVPPRALTNSIGTGTSSEWNVSWTAAYGDNASLAWQNWDDLSGKGRIPAVFDCLAWSVRVTHNDYPPEYEGDSLIMPIKPRPLAV
jgi:prepilin-type N-terminal cleavage/methylation domain-containing protein